jgi:hypothetical protein
VSQLTLYNGASLPPTVGARLWTKPRSQRHRTQKRVVTVRRTSASSPSALLRLVLRTQPCSGPADFGAIPGLQISHSEKFDNSHAQKELWLCLS